MRSYFIIFNVKFDNLMNLIIIYYIQLLYINIIIFKIMYNFIFLTRFECYILKNKRTIIIKI